MEEVTDDVIESLSELMMVSMVFEGCGQYEDVVGTFGGCVGKLKKEFIVWVGIPEVVVANIEAVEVPILES